MCGIAGTYNYRTAPRVDSGALMRMRDAMQTRGPDGAGLWTSADGAVGLAHRRLSILDLSDRGAQPMATKDKALWITYNGEIYNFRELRQELEKHGVIFQSGSDTEVLLQLYRTDGPKMLPKLRGMFAFALWDSEKRCLLLARDPFGIKPLYFADDGITIRFASQVKAILAGGEVDKRLSSAGQVGFFLWGHIPEPYTVYQSIHSLPPGHAMVATEGMKPQSWKYQDALDTLVAVCDSPKLCKATAPREELLRSAMEETVRHHMVADVPVGCFLSSGIDSNVLCAFASQMIRGGQLETVTLGFEEYLGTSKDEVPLAAKSASRLGVKHRVRTIAQPEFERDMRRLLEYMDQPTVNGVNSFFVAKAAAEAGLKVALSGVGADEVFGGYPSFTQIPRLVAICSQIPFGSALGVASRYLLAPILKRTASSKYASLLEFGTSFGGAHFLRRGLFMPWELPEILNEHVVREGLAQLESPSELDHRLPSNCTPYVRVMASEIRDYLQPRLLRDADWAGMAHSVEIRTPFVDVFFFRQIAQLLKLLPAPPSKRDLAHCSPSPLPSSIIERRKTGFNVPVHDWLQRKNAEPSGSARGLRSWSKVVAERFGFELVKPAGGYL